MSKGSAPFAYNTYDSLPEVPLFTLTSTDISEGSTMPPAQLSKAFGLPGGQDESPSLKWSGFPADTKSFVVTLYDPDAPCVSGFWHWVVYDIPASVTELPTGAGTPGSSLLPAGAKMLKNDAGMPGFMGSAPPEGHGQHRYIFCVTALPVESLPIDEASTTPSVAHFHMFGAGVLGRAFLTAHFGR
jgi:Raf kinase inhibitor-like YbhB/YbcL family protein